MATDERIGSESVAIALAWMDGLNRSTKFDVLSAWTQMAGTKSTQGNDQKVHVKRAMSPSQNCARPKILVNLTSVATRVLQHPWGQRDSIMPRSKEDDAARKREERSARPADDAAARSSDDAARKRGERSARSAARQHRLQHRLAQEAATLGAAMTVAATVDDLTGLLEQ